MLLFWGKLETYTDSGSPHYLEWYQWPHTHFCGVCLAVGCHMGTSSNSSLGKIMRKDQRWLNKLTMLSSQKRGGQLMSNVCQTNIALGFWEKKVVGKSNEPHTTDSKGWPTAADWLTSACVEGLKPHSRCKRQRSFIKTVLSVTLNSMFFEYRFLTFVYLFSHRILQL